MLVAVMNTVCHAVIEDDEDFSGLRPDGDYLLHNNSSKEKCKYNIYLLYIWFII